MPTTIKPSRDANRWARRRLRRHGDQYYIILDHYIDHEPAPGHGLMCKSCETEKYVWFNRNDVIIHEDSPYTRTPVAVMIEGVQSYTYNKDMLDEYLNHLMSNVLSKRDQKKYKPLYDNIKAHELSLVERLNA